MGSAIPLAGQLPDQEKKYTCKITVLKKTLNGDFSKKFKNEQGSICDVFQEGQEFIVKSPYAKPEGFNCDWAWADIRTFIHVVLGGTMNKFVTCCTDGYRPVFFLLERIEI